MLAEDAHVDCYKLLEPESSVFPKSWGQVFKECEFKHFILVWDLDLISIAGSFKVMQR